MKILIASGAVLALTLIRQRTRLHIEEDSIVSLSSRTSYRLVARNSSSGDVSGDCSFAARSSSPGEAAGGSELRTRMSSARSAAICTRTGGTNGIALALSLIRITERTAAQKEKQHIRSGSNGIASGPSPIRMRRKGPRSDKARQRTTINGPAIKANAASAISARTLAFLWNKPAATSPRPSHFSQAMGAFRYPRFRAQQLRGILALTVPRRAQQFTRRGGRLFGATVEKACRCRRDRLCVPAGGSAGAPRYAATLTMPACDVGSGIGSPPSRISSRCASSASRKLRSHSCASCRSIRSPARPARMPTNLGPRFHKRLRIPSILASFYRIVFTPDCLRMLASVPGASVSEL